MKKFLQKKLKNEKGLTLVELLAVIVILGIIAAIAIPSIGSIIENSRIKAVKADAQTVLSAANIYFAEGNTGNDGNAGVVSVTLVKLVEEGFLEDTASFNKDTSAKVYKEGTNKALKISGTGTSKNVSVTFTKATSEQITLSGNDVKVPNS
ncbi:prepilin-type N-terminal cleavage/methylation domain-containing protein [Sporosarcina gallistercoris]|uniref:prepilin-type N-terminal cleavage/methylation domain-containing protein n=1 Tax=Sporosarcina gallistercoris TaxID=2762245 RepID=UPI003D296564